MIVALDLETTGLDKNNCAILEIALVKFNEKTFAVKERFSTLINPELEIPPLISNITNIFYEDIKDAPKWEEKKEEVENFIGDCPILGHNTQFDSGFLRSNGIELKNNIELDTFEFANFLLLEEKSLSLESLSLSLGLELEGAHRALNDTLATLKLFEVLIDKMKNMSTTKLEFLDYVANNSENPSFKYVYNNILEKKSILKTDEDFIEKLLKVFSTKGKFIKKEFNSEFDFGSLEEFIKGQSDLELRENQLLMSGSVGDTLSNEKKIVIEAPTGVGKTFAYLLPSIFHSIKTGEQVYISTSTKALQDQIFYKDLQFLSNKLPLDFSYSKLKGKANYLGIAAFINFFTGVGNLTKEESTFVLKILFWLTKTYSGELDELDFYGREFLFLKEINAEDLITFSKENVYEKFEFAVNARRNARKSNIVIINNNILFQDIDGDNSILGKVENLILDEAHNLEDVVTHSLKKSFGLRDFEKQLINIEKIIKKNKITLDGLGRKVDTLMFEMGIIFDTFQLYLNKKINSNEKYQNILLKEDFYAQDVDNIDKSELSNLIQLKITDLLDSFSLLPDSVYLSLGREINFLEGVILIIKVLLSNKDNDQYIKLVNYNEKRGGIILEYTLLNVGDYLERNLWSKLNSCVLTSATLQIGESFEYITNMLQLKDFAFSVLESDFNYQTQALLFIPEDLGSIKNNLSAVISFLQKLFLAARGNTLVLFTAFYAIKETYSQVFPTLKKEGISLYAQSIGGGKHKLIEAFKNNAHNSVLIGTDTFWEGIDIPGDDLKYLVIHKVPFMVPTDPIFQARSTLFTNGFMEYGVPKAILKLKQGFGRLIRSKQDNGVVVFLDDRIYSTVWGNILYNAFPKDIKIRKGESQDFIKILEDKKKD